MSAIIFKLNEASIDHIIILISQMKRFYKFKLNNPRYCLNLLPSNEKKVFSSDIVIPLPNRMANGCRLLLINCGKVWNPKVISTDEIFRSVILSLEAAIAEPRTQVCSIQVLLSIFFLSFSSSDESIEKFRHFVNILIENVTHFS